MASVTTDAHEVKMVNQTIPLLSPETDSCLSVNKKKKTEVPYMTRMFLKGEPVALGTVQIMIGIIMLCLGAVTWFTQVMYGEIPLGLGLSFFLSGSVTLSAHKRICPPLMKSTIALNIITALLALSGTCYFCYALAIKPTVSSCNGPTDGYYTYYDCKMVALILRNVINGVMGILLILSVLEVCVCTTTIVFSCKAILQVSGTKMPVAVVQGKDSSQDSLLKNEVASVPSAYEP